MSMRHLRSQSLHIQMTVETFLSRPRCHVLVYITPCPNGQINTADAFSPSHLYIQYLQQTSPPKPRRSPNRRSLLFPFRLATSRCLGQHLTGISSPRRAGGRGPTSAAPASTSTITPTPSRTTSTGITSLGLQRGGTGRGCCHTISMATRITVCRLTGRGVPEWCRIRRRR